jgi:hypothetical protein
MKIENKMKYNRVKEALIRWALGIGGQVLDVIPWSKEIESVIPWEDVCDEIDKSFGSRTDEKGKLWDAGIILTNADELERFMSFIIEKTNKVMTVYQGIIDKANRLCNTRFEIIVHKFIGVENNVAQYEPIYRYFGNNLTSLANEVYDKLKVSDWENDDFIDSVHYGLYCNSSVVFNSKYLNEHNLRLDVKRNC